MPKKGSVAKKGPARQRSAADMTESQALSQGITSENPRDPNAGKRPPRVPLQNSLKLKVPGYEFDWDNFQYRFFSESHSSTRVQDAKAAWWEHCVDHEGNPITRKNGSGGRTFLMRLPREHWEKDLAAKRQKVAATLDDQTKLGKNEYAPTENAPEGGRTSMVRQTESRTIDHPGDIGRV